MPSAKKSEDEEEKGGDEFLIRIRCRSLDVYSLNRYAPIEVDFDDEEQEENDEIDMYIQGQ